MNTQDKPVVIVTGSSGFIGSAVIRALAPTYRLVGFDRAGAPDPPPQADKVDVDVTSDQSVRAGLEHVRARYGDHIASVVHLAAYYDFSGEPSPLYEEVTVKGTERLLGELRRMRLDQFLFSSTMLVHAPCDVGERIDEDWPIEPKWDYPKSKVRTEAVIRSGRGDIRSAVLRIAGVYDDRCHSIPIAHQIQRIYERTLTSHLFPGDLSHGQAFVHLDDLVGAIHAAVDRREALPEESVFLVGEPETVGYGELQREIGLLLFGEEWETREIPKPLAKAGAWIEDAVPFAEEPFIKPWMVDIADDHYALDISRANAMLGWEPRRLLRGILPRMIEALKADPERWYRENKLEWSSAAESGERKVEDADESIGEGRHER